MKKKYASPNPFYSVAIPVAFIFIPFIIFLMMDKMFPLSMPEDEKSFAVTVIARDGTPLRSFPDEKGVWRYPVRVSEVSPLYLKALLSYEDRLFWHHPGVNIYALFRAVFQYVQTGKPQSGGSTITMQVARLFHPHSKTIPGKLRQMFRALQLEFYYSKKEILTMYLNYAPFGGPVEGVQAASFAYLGKSAKELSHAEAALLAVLPQAPSRLRPDRHAGRATRARNKVLNRMAQFGVWDRETVEEAKIERVTPRFNPRPMMVPLLARRLKSETRNSKFETRNSEVEIRNSIIRTFIDPYMQQAVADLVYGFIQGTPEHTSAAALVVENKSLAVKAYVGSGDFLDDSRFGHVDMIRAYRSPGSTLKSFLYGFALEEGLIHSESLLVDAPFSFSGYRPENFTQAFSGPVSVSEALQRSLNIPAVDILDRLGPKFFDTRLRQGGLRLRFPPHQEPNLTMILGGVGASLEDLVSAYTAFACQGLAGKLRYTTDDPISERRLLSPGAAYIIRQILQEHRRPDLPGGRVSLEHSRGVAWKTGTSYGFRDAWSVGVTDRHTIGVWVGRPDGTPSPGQYGRATAAPLLFSIVDSLPRGYGPPPSVPESVARAEICWPLGTRPSGKEDSLCHQRRHAWILNDVIPPTFPDRADRHWLSNPMTILVHPESGLRVDADCPVPNPVRKTIARWPRAAEPWLNPCTRAACRPPRLDPVCKKPVSSCAENIRIMGIESDTVFRPPGAETKLPTITLQAQGGQGRLYWLLNGELVHQTGIGETRFYQFKRPGRYQLTVMDLGGNYDAVEIVVLGGNFRG
ncbi:penicillin-binding protein 1C [Desulfonema magnum]|nr:penicillin-binding protein 1C [Desulfonema magnum]